PTPRVRRGPSLTGTQDLYRASIGTPKRSSTGPIGLAMEMTPLPAKTRPTGLRAFVPLCATTSEPESPPALKVPGFVSSQITFIFGDYDVFRCFAVRQTSSPALTQCTPPACGLRGL